MTFKELRNGATMSQRQLGKEIGLTSSAINQYEKGKRKPDIDTVSALSAALGVSVEQVVECFTKKEKK